MADIRIKDLTTTASSTASDDFIAVDGTTNGTRKLNAFSPSFGGNATVTGTLTANGGATVGGGSFAAASFYKSSSLGSVLSGATGSSYDLYITNPAGNYILQVPTGTRNAEFAGTLTTVGNATVGAALTVQATTASTTTSTGALVVGNGTSGGLGVGGAITAGGGITSTNPGGVFQITGTGNTGASKELIFYRSDGGDTLNFGLTGTAYAGILTGLGNNEAYFYYSSSSAFRIFLGTAATQRYDFTANQFKINQTTASTTTSSGALVVSGGVGVAGAIYAGGALFTVAGAGFNTPDWRFYQSGTSGYIRDLVNGQMALQFVSGNASTIQVYATGTQDSTSTTSGALVSSGGLGVAGAVNAGTFYGLVDGVPAPATAGGYARIYVDSADGDLKVKFGDGTVKTIATDS